MTNFSTSGSALPYRPTQRSAVFEDVNEGDYFAEPVYWAADRGVTNGVDDTHFDPHSPCTRGQVVTFLWRYINTL